MKRKLINGIGIGIIASILVLLDSLYCSFVFPGKSFVWIAFVSWTIYLTSNLTDRLKSISGYIIGIALAIIMMKFGNLLFAFFPLTINGQSQTSFIGTFFIISILMICYEYKLLEFTSIGSIFTGMWLIFSGLGALMYPTDLESFIIIFIVIMCYTIIGLMAGALSMKLYSATEKSINKKH